jgi:hypothetical protein
VVVDFLHHSEAQRAEELMLGFFHVAVVAGKVDDASHVGVGKLDAAFCDEVSSHKRIGTCQVEIVQRASVGQYPAGEHETTER